MDAMTITKEQAESSISAPEFKLMPKREVKSWIARIKVAVQELDEDIKSCMIQCLAHAKTHGDVTLIEELADALPEGRWNNGFRQWLYRNSPIRARDDGTFHQLKEIDPKTGEKTRGYRPYNLEAASNEDPLPKPKTGNNRKERMFSLVDINNIPEMYKKRMERAKEEGRLIEGDEKKIVKTLNAFSGVIEDLALKPTRVIEQEAPEKLPARKVKSKLIPSKKKITVDPMKAAA